MTTNYDDIRLENERKYGTDTWYEDILSNMYSDKTHFIYELIQNAEDAYASEITFHVFKDRVEVVHNGKKLFSTDDVKGVCGLAKGTKKEDLTKIGKFGLGFKSVYAYTDKPQIYSGEESFRIERFVRPFSIPKLFDLNKTLTKFIFPFKASIDKNKSFEEIKNKLIALDLKTSLFLKEIKIINWIIEDGDSGKYVKEPRNDPKYDIQRICYISTIKKEEVVEHWLLFKKETEIEKRPVELAFKIEYGDGKDFKILSTDKTELIVFFPTEKETHLKFLVQGPFITTHNRESIPPEDPWNQKIMQLICNLITETMLRFKKEKLLNVDTFQLFPINKSDFSEESMFYSFYNAVKSLLLSEEEILPAYDGSYVSSRNALIARTNDLRTLLSSNQISLLFSKENVRWLNSSITIDKLPLVREYLINEILIEEITPEKFATSFTEKFIKHQSDEWIIDLYKFLSKQDALLRPKTYWQTEGILRSKPFIRLKNGDHLCPFDNSGKAQVYLPSNNSYDSFFKTIKSAICSDPDVKEFFKKLGIKEPNKVAGVREHILTKYQTENIIVTKEENLKDIEYIKKTIESDPGQEINDLLTELKDINFLLARDQFANILCWTSPSKIYLGKTYTKSDEIEIYFEANPDVYFLDERYCNNGLSLDFLEKIGCSGRIRVFNKKPDAYNNHIILNDAYGYHKRGLDGFDPDFRIDGLLFALKNINIAKASILWNYLKKHISRIKGIIESSTRQSFENSSKKEEYSETGNLITAYSWLPDKTGAFHQPSQLLLSELSDSFDKESAEAKVLSETIMKNPIGDEIIEALPDQEKDLIKIFRSLPENERSGFIDSLNRQRKNSKAVVDNSGAGKDKNYSELLNENLRETNKSIEDTDTVIYPEITSDKRSDEERQTQTSEEIDEAIRETEDKKQKMISRKENLASQIDNEIKTKLLQDYDGRCQICFERILDTDNKPHMVFKRLVTPHQSDLGISDESNILALCPNCSLRVKLKLFCFIKENKESLEPDFENLEDAEKGDRVYKAIKIKLNGCEHTKIHYKKEHLEKFIHLYKNY